MSTAIPASATATPCHPIAAPADGPARARSVAIIGTPAVLTVRSCPARPGGAVAATAMLVPAFASA